MKTLTPDDVARWWMEKYKPEGGRTSYAKYHEMTGACSALFKYVSQGQGYDRRSNQQWVRVALPKDGDVDAALAELYLFLPHIRPTDGYKHISLLEYALSEYGMYELRGYEQDVRLVKTTHGVEQEEARFDSWFDALTYVRANHWIGPE